jgi:prefoldin subunit 5
MEAQVDKIEPIIINVGLNVYLELNLEEALKFLEMKIKSINNESDLIREQSLKVRSEIKILLMYLAEQQGFSPSEK